MKILLKIIGFPIVTALWLLTKAASIFTYISGLVLGITSGIAAVIGIGYLVTGAVKNGIIGLILAYLMSPYGIPLFAIILLGVMQKTCLTLRGKLYGQ